MSKWTRSNPLAAVPGYNVPRGHFANGYTNGGDRVGFKVGGRVGKKHGFQVLGGGVEGKPHSTREGRDAAGRRKFGRMFNEPKFLDTKSKLRRPKRPKKAEGGRIGLKEGSDKNWIQKAVNPKHKGFCTPMTKKTCTPKRKALAKTFKKMGRARKGKA